MPIEVKNLTHTYMRGTPFETRAVDDVTFSVEDGEFIGVIGHTGSGKSTLIMHLNALIKPESGTVIVDGLDLSDKGIKLADVRKRVGLVFQYPEYQLFEETVEKDIAFGPKNLKLSQAEIDERVRSALTHVGLSEDVLPRSPFELSGGQKRRVAIAGVLAMCPATLILDEPAAGLDPEGRAEMLDFIRRIHETGVTVIMVSHSMDDVSRLCERLIVLDHGKIALDGTPEFVFSHPDEILNMGLGLPECFVLSRRLAEAGLSMPDGIFRLDELKLAILNALKKEEGHA